MPNSTNPYANSSTADLQAAQNAGTLDYSQLTDAQLGSLQPGYMTGRPTDAAAASRVAADRAAGRTGFIQNNLSTYRGNTRPGRITVAPVGPEQSSHSVQFTNVPVVHATSSKASQQVKLFGS